MPQQGWEGWGKRHPAGALTANGKTPVTRELAIKGYITSSAKVTRYRLVEPLRAEGINPDDYREDFDYE